MKKSIVVIGKESVGKSQLIRSLTGKGAISEKLKGTTVAVQSYETEKFRFIDTPGILLESDSLTTKMALEQIPNKDCVVLTISATSIDQDLEDLLPLVQDMSGVIVITHWDKMHKNIKPETIQMLEEELGVPILKVDARNISSKTKKDLGLL